LPFACLRKRRASVTFCRTVAGVSRMRGRSPDRRGTTIPISGLRWVSLVALDQRSHTLLPGQRKGCRYRTHRT
jgi:hypothetical protein